MSIILIAIGILIVAFILKRIQHKDEVEMELAKHGVSKNMTKPPKKRKKTKQSNK